MSLSQRFLRDLKASPPKTAMLAILFLVGLWFWVPPVWHAVAGTSDPPVVSVQAPVTAAPAIASGEQSPKTPALSPRPSWTELERVREDDPLYRSAEQNEIRDDAFVLYGDFLPIEVAFGEEPKPPKPKPAGPPPPPPPPLTLRSTLIGSAGRAALINGRTYPEGATILAGGKPWLLSSIEARRVVLECEGRKVELKIDPFSSSKNQIGR